MNFIMELAVSPAVIIIVTLLVVGDRVNISALRGWHVILFFIVILAIFPVESTPKCSKRLSHRSSQSHVIGLKSRGVYVF